jgi:hypothetical protein
MIIRDAGWADCSTIEALHPRGRILQACGYCFGTSPKPSASCASVGHETSTLVFTPSSTPLGLELSTPRPRPLAWS